MKTHFAAVVTVTVCLILAGSSVHHSAAQTTTETKITITTENVGSFSVSFVGLSGGYHFLDASGGNSISVSALEGDTAFATAKLAWTDTRADGQRFGYTFTLEADDLTSEIGAPNGAPYTIPATNLEVVEIDGRATDQPQPLDEPQTIFSAKSEPPAGDHSITLGLKLTIDPSTYPTTYTTTLRLQVVHGDA